jgi:hypothetical protein
VPQDSWGIVPVGTRIFAVEFLDDILLARLLNERELVIPREDVCAVYLHGVLPHSWKDSVAPGSSSHRSPSMIASGGPLSRARKGSRQEEDSRQHARKIAATEPSLLGEKARILHERLEAAGWLSMEFCLTLYCPEPVGPLRLRKEGFDFSCLGPEKKAHSLDNFLTVVERTLQFVSKAWNREDAVAFLADPDPERILCFKEEMVDNLDRWICHWVQVEAESRASK